MASTHIALLRGINVGRAKRVAMADLRALVEGLGYTNVRTLLNSGNIVFTSSAQTPKKPPKDASSAIERALMAKTGVSAKVTVLTAAELDAVVTGNPLLRIADDPSRLLVAVLNSPKDRPRLEALAKEPWTPDALALGPRVAYLWCAGGILESRLAKALDRLLGDAVTSRNWATVMKLKALAEAGGT